MNTSKQINIMIILVFAAVIAAGAYTVWDPHRAADAKDVQLQKTVDRGAYLFSQNCRQCHGDMGEGGAKGNRLSLAPPLNRPDLQGKKTADGPVDKASKDAAYKLVFNTVTCGRVGKAMPTWGDSQGGPLNPEQIKDLAVFITEGTAWHTEAEYAVEGSDTNHLTLAKPLDSSSTDVFINSVAALGKSTYIKVVAASDAADPAKGELMLITDVNKDANSVTVERAQGNTKAESHNAGDKVLVAPPILDPAKVAITQPACGQTLPVVQPTAPSGTPTPAPTPAANAQHLALVGENIEFNTQTLTANSSSPIVIDFDNKDDGVPHNVHVFKGTDATGESVGQTDIANGPTTQTLDLGTLAPGTYYYHCDVHPTTMFGTLTVQ